MPANEAIHFYEPGKSITCKAGAAVTGKRAVAITGNRTSGPGLSATAEGGVYTVGAVSAGGRIFGVAAHDAAINELVTVLRGGIVPIRAGAAISAFAEVEVDANGQVITKSSGVAIGFVATGASNGADAEVVLYNG